MRRIMTGQILLIVCCFFYLIWWYRGYRPGITANRISGTNGLLLLITAFLGVAGISFSLMPVPLIEKPAISTISLIAAGITAYIILLLVTKYAFQRIVTTELFLIVGWTMLEVAVINRLNAAGFLSGRGFAGMCTVITAAFAVSLILYVAYYRMEETKAFYAAMIPLITEAATMAILVILLRQNL